MSTATISHAIFGGWAGVTDTDVPAIGWSIIPDHEEQFAYLADPAAFREPTEDELKAYAARRADPASCVLPWLYAPYSAPDFRPAPPVHVTPVPPVSQPVTASGEIVPASGPVADATRDRLAAEAAQRAEAEAAREKALAAFNAAHDQQDAAEAKPDATQIIPAAGQITEAIEAVTDGGDK
jgi:hypothetical protein